MSFIADALSPPVTRASTDWLDDRWYSRDLSGFAGGGVSISHDTILSCGTVLAAVRFRGDSWAMCPPSTFRKTATGRIEEPKHYSQKLLRNPNAWQTGNRWRHLMGVWLATHGNATNEIVGGRTSFAEELWPLYPTTVTVVDQRNDGSLLYLHRPLGLQPERRLGQEKILHFRDIGVDGFVGLPMYAMIRNIVAVALLAEAHAATFLKKGTRISGLLVPTGPLSKPQRDELRESANAAFGGATATGSLGILPHGVDLKPLSLSNREGQVMELGDQAVGAILRALGVPGVVVGWMGDKTSTYASAEAFFEKGGIKHCVLPILTNVEAEEEKALLVDGAGLQIKHNLDALLRANLADRYAAHSRALGGAPFLTVNEVRSIEDWNEDPDPRNDEIRIPANLTPPDPNAPEPAAPPVRPAEPPPAEDASAAMVLRGANATAGLVLAEMASLRALADTGRALAERNARGLVRSEVEAIAGAGKNGKGAAAQRMAGDPAAWRAWVTDFYDRHSARVATTMLVGEADARAYAAAQRDAVLASLAIIETWEATAVPQLVALALGEKPC